MGCEWATVPFNDLGEINRGRSRHRPRYAEHLYGGPYPFIQTGDIRESGGRITSHSQTYSEEGLKQSRLWPAGTMCITIAANIAETAILSYPACFPDSVVGFIADDKKCHVRFVEYTFRHIKRLIQAEASGSVQDNINLGTLSRLEIPLPPLPEQKAIAHVLGSLDDKIELNRRMNETLEGMAQALFKSWFVDFDPVIDNALAAGNPIPEPLAQRAETRRQAIANGAANRESAQSFPASFRFTEELGWIPEGWQAGSIADLAKLNPESWTNKKHPDSVNYVDLANTKNGRINETTLYEFEKAPSRARRILKPHDTILGTVRPENRSFAYIQDNGLTGSTGFAVLRPVEASSRSFIYLSLTQDDVIKVFAHLADGAAYPAIRPEVVSNTHIAIPNASNLQVFELFGSTLLRKIGEHQQESQTLAKLRDVLLPKLISGELSIPQAEKMVEKAIA
jgi:type I restriction enzyme S subunit